MADETAALVQNIITKADEEIKSVEVHKSIDLEYDTGNLLVTDKNNLDEKILRDRNRKECYLVSVLSDRARSPITEMSESLSGNIGDANVNKVIINLIRLPREKKAPKGKILTKWEQYAKDKGIQQKKKNKKVWDETLKRWVPRWGMRKNQADKEKNWVMEVPVTANPYEDQFAKAADVKKERIAKNEWQRLRNIAKARKVKVPNVGVTGNQFASTKDLGMAMHHAKSATASLGKFQKNVPNEKKVKGLGKKRKLELQEKGHAAEKERSLEVFKKIKKAELNLEGAVNKQITNENIADDMQKKKKAGSGAGQRRSKMGGRQRGNSEQKAAAKKGAGGRGGRARKNKGAGAKGEKWNVKGQSKGGKGKGVPMGMGKSKGKPRK
ncbi:unnamed protein product [Meganyctiphanes norvegica]|uniref:Ribosome biogenesis regulatory protein n=1 Tax=Meganyctiphanes norvegica TaxID=48144 RepID=A0AAV2PTG7_MEGNR